MNSSISANHSRTRTSASPSRAWTSPAPTLFWPEVFDDRRCPIRSRHCCASGVGPWHLLGCRRSGVDETAHVKSTVWSLVVTVAITVGLGALLCAATIVWRDRLEPIDRLLRSPLCSSFPSCRMRCPARGTTTSRSCFRRLPASLCSTLDRRGKLLRPAHAVLVLALWVTITFAAAIVAVSRRDGSAPSDPRRCRHHTTNRRGDS